MDAGRFRKLPIMGILRTSGAGVPIEDLTDSVIASGLETMEIAMNSDDAAALVGRAVKAAKGRLTIGAGTVLDMDILKAALDAGATFVVMPTLVAGVVEYCVKNSVPVFPGAFTPQEIYNAWNAGATMVKVFPAAMFGPSYIKEVRAPFKNIDLLACGGITPGNIRDYFESGAAAVAFGNSVFRKEWIDKRDFASIEDSIRRLIASMK
ncbi:MAG: bifunctional 4-hydroxy-2-oxoglutarate aldolase/2-dehydro-3-deoxy-phosphogluconate aldolase [Candidatus Omnitrophica bacterium]|nr:bifunctional 4-hydroxy-2-oxoglutarate aldolase/2-dehydro-3-deoxy-phosphogluconate aldolase [Candidatus Omnitrophota bacterium]